MNTDFIEWEVQVVKYRPPGGDMWGRLLSVGTSPYGRGTYGYAHSPLRDVRPPGTNKEEPRTADGRRLVYGMGGCDPYGGVRNHGVDVSPRSTTPGYVMGMLRIP